MVFRSPRSQRAAIHAFCSRAGTGKASQVKGVREMRGAGNKKGGPPSQGESGLCRHATLVLMADLTRSLSTVGAGKGADVATASR